MERRLLDALSLATQNFATSNPVKEQSNGRCPVGMSYTTTNQLVWISKLGEYIHIGVGFGVARSTGLGNAKALSCGTSNR